MSTLHAVDFVILAFSIIALFVVALFTTWKRRKTQTVDEYFLSGRGMPWWAIGASLFASNIGTEHFVGQAGTAAATGLAVSWYEWGAIWLLLLLGWVFGPEYIARQLCTIPEWFELRFNKWCRLILAVVCLAAYIVSKIAATLYAAGVMFEVIFHWSTWYTVPAVLVLTGLYTMGGGLSAVMYTDTIQMFIFFIGGMGGTITAFSIVGGYYSFVESVDKYTPDNYMTILRPVYDPEYAWTGMLIGQTISSLWYWCIDQEMAQRILSAQSLAQARWGIIMAGWCKMLSPLVIVFPGMIARILYERCQHTNAFPEWCATNLNDGANSDKAYPYLITLAFPIGVKGIMVSSMIAAMTSSLSSVFNSASTVFTVDVYKRFIQPNASDKAQMVVGRVSTLVVTGLAIGWLPVIQSQSGQLYLITQKAMTHLAPTLSVVFLLGFFFPFVNSIGASVGLVIGTVIGVVQLVLSLIWEKECKASATLTHIGSPWWKCLHFNHFAIFLSLVVAVFAVGVSLATGGWKNRHINSQLGTRDDVEEAQNGKQCEEMTESSATTKPPTATGNETLAHPLLNDDTDGDDQDGVSPEQLTACEDNENPTNYKSDLLYKLHRHCFLNPLIQHACGVSLFVAVAAVLIVYR